MADQSNPLLDLLGGLSKGIQEVAAFRQAALGNPAPVQMLQEQQRQQNLLNQLQTMSQQEMAGPFGETLKRQLQFGDVAGAQKTLASIPRYKQVQTLVQDPKLGLNEADQSMIQSISAVDPQLGLDLLKRTKGESLVSQRQQSILEQTFKQRSALEEKKAARLEAKLPGNVVARAIENKEVDPTDIAGVVGVLQSSGVKLPTNENEARLFASRILSSPKIKAMIPQEQKKSWTESFKSFFSGKQGQSAAPVQQMQSPQQQGQVLVSPSTGRRFMKNADGSLTELK